MLRNLARRIFSGGYSSSHPTLQGDVDVMAYPSQNVLITGTGRTRIWKGVKSISSVSGSKVMMNVGDTYGGLGDSGETGIGSIFRVLGSIFFIGQGSLFYQGTDTTASATTTLSLKTITSGSLSATYQAGSAEPSAPSVTVVTAPSGYEGRNNGVVSVRISRIRSTTGAESNASPTSTVVAPASESVAITFPSADANGQDYWAVYATKNAEGGIGNHYFLQEIAESVIAATITATATTDADTTINLPNGTLDATNIGWQYTSAGDTTTYVTDVGADDSGSLGAGYQEVTLAAASVLSTSQSATFTRAVAGTTRTYVFEWRDSDLDFDLAPIRNYPPPAGVFGGSIEDVVFVDGCYGDTANVVAKSEGGNSGLLDSSYSAANVGNAIAVSDPVKPESYPPDNYLFTGDAPTCLLAGANGVYWRFAQNSLGVIRYVGGSPALSYERIWTGVGVVNQNNAALGQGGRVYAYTADRGAVRMGADGMPDTLFAAPVADDMASWTAANVIVGFDGDNQMVCFMHDDDILAYYEPLGVWCAPLVIDENVTTTGTLRSAVTVNGSMLLAWEASGQIDLYNFDQADATYKTTAIASTPWIPVDQVSAAIHRIGVAMRADTVGNDVTVALYANGSGSARRSFTVTPASTGFIQLPVLRPSVRNCKTYRLQLTYQHNGTDAGFDMINIEGVDENIVW